jgi:acetolactate synthase I/II/III large subunit
MKLSDYVAGFLVEQGVTDTFVLTGGCIVHIIDSIAQHPNINYLPVHHEQAGAMAADAFSRVTGKIGVALATSGPGATNLLTGVCCSYYDSIPVVLITGQVPSSQLKRDSLSRQIGFQETDVVSIFRPVTKYAKLIDEPSTIRYELEKAFFTARNGRPGPVLLDICDDVQRADINPESLLAFVPEAGKVLDNNGLRHQVCKMIEMINQAERPVLILGGGVRLAGAVGAVRVLVESFGLPYSLTWAAMDYLPHANNLFVGGFGVTSGRAGNFAVQNADLIVAIGTRLDSHEAGPNLKNFAREAKKIVVDIDSAEQEKYAKMGMDVDLLITEDASKVIAELLALGPTHYKAKSRADWMAWIQRWTRAYPSCSEEFRNQPELVNPYAFMEALAERVDEHSIIVTDCGSNLIWTMQGFRVSSSQRIISAFNHSPMGYSIPASIGAAIAKPDHQVVCITGDAGLQINIQELAIIAHNRFNVKIFVMNNHSHGIIQGTQDNWLGGRHHASCPNDGNLPDCDVVAIAQAYGLQVDVINSNNQLNEVVERVLSQDGPVLCNVNQKTGAQICPKLLFGRPLEDSDPLLPRPEFYANMIVAPIT